jgi:hypothetical protein
MVDGADDGQWTSRWTALQAPARPPRPESRSFQSCLLQPRAPPERRQRLGIGDRDSAPERPAFRTLSYSLRKDGRVQAYFPTYFHASYGSGQKCLAALARNGCALYLVFQAPPEEDHIVHVTVLRDQWAACRRAHVTRYDVAASRADRASSWGAEKDRGPGKERERDPDRGPGKERDPDRGPLHGDGPPVFVETSKTYFQVYRARGRHLCCGCRTVPRRCAVGAPQHRSAMPAIQAFLRLLDAMFPGAVLLPSSQEFPRLLDALRGSQAYSPCHEQN